LAELIEDIGTSRGYRGRKPKGQGGDRRREILDAAREIYLTEGYEQTTIRKVGQRVGVSSTALYVYFTDKDALIAAVCDEILEPLTQAGLLAQAEIAKAQTPKAIETLLRQFAEGYVRFGLSNPMVYFRMFIAQKPVSWDHRSGAYMGEVRYSSRFNLFGFAADVIAKGQELGVFKPGDPALLTEVSWAAIHGLVAIRISDPDAPYAPLEDQIATMLDILMQGLKGSAAN
jgi:AcrR family transcriptional regulator